MVALSSNNNLTNYIWSDIMRNKLGDASKQFKVVLFIKTM